MGRSIDAQPEFSRASLEEAVEIGLCAWAVGSLAQASAERAEGESSPAVRDGEQAKAEALPDKGALLAHVRQTVAEKSLECIVLERNGPGSSKYRALRPEELGRLLPPAIRASRSD
jgi:hypothetical protein